MAKRQFSVGTKLKSVKKDARLPSGSCTTEMRDQIVEASAAEGINGSEFMRRAVAFYLAQHSRNSVELVAESGNHDTAQN